eukprot:CAMPEP_0194359958 /NCGR_PEP_ID=MMETSP0174-20130528/7243_1 /TAXON_ID=216777 /ORGANISM="Proboscia alata, Strain PI-D3" /LENGTH=353 /DNA_ID=CAMNT_0039131157 /DNA_START=32 /DNA_END=1096 /DNA_ORIENTATION=-
MKFESLATVAIAVTSSLNIVDAFTQQPGLCNIKRSLSQMSRTARKSKQPSSTSLDESISQNGLPQFELVDLDGLILIKNAVDPSLRMELFDRFYRSGIMGECGGSWKRNDSVKGTVYGANDAILNRLFTDAADKPVHSVKGDAVEMGLLHGQHRLEFECESDENETVEQRFLESLNIPMNGRKVDPNYPAGDFDPTHLALSFEMVGGRTINRKKTLCGWSGDGDLARKDDGTPKLFINLGNHAVECGFKHDKKDKDSIDVTVNPGDAILRYNSARTWKQAVLSITPADSKDTSGSEVPFDFVWVKFEDHGPLKRGKRDVWEKIHGGKKNGLPNAWFQYKYTSLGGTKCVVELP